MESVAVLEMPAATAQFVAAAAAEDKAAVAANGDTPPATPPVIEGTAQPAAGENKDKTAANG